MKRETIDFTKAYSYKINQSLIERFWRKKGCPEYLARKQMGMIMKIKQYPHGELVYID